MKYVAMRIKFREEAPELLFSKKGWTKAEALTRAAVHVHEWELTPPDSIELMDNFGTVFERIKVWETEEGDLLAIED